MVQTFILRSTDDNQETVRTRVPARVEPFDELRRALVEVRTVFSCYIPPFILRQAQDEREILLCLS